MDNWEEVKTAYTVGVLGTVTAASEALEVHRATVIRHIDSLEEKLEQQLFLRQTNGYTPTEVGRELIRVVKVTDEQFNILSDKMRGIKERLSGELTITSPEFLAPLVMPAVAQFHVDHPNIKTRYLISEEMMKLEYGEAHLAVRPVLCPKDPVHESDNLVIPFCDYTVGLYASPAYIERHGKPDSPKDFHKHYFIDRGLEYSRHVPPFEQSPAFEQWLRKHAPHENFVFSCQSPPVLHLSIITGTGIGFLPYYKARLYPELVEVIPRLEEWIIPISFIVHHKMYETEKVRELINILKSDTYEF
ncbi:MAG: LysR family transcriptional regulator [Pseudomonadota bacterium]